MNGTLFFLLDSIVFFALSYLLVFLRHGELSASLFVKELWVFVPIFLLVSFVVWLFSFYDVKQLRKRKIAYKSLAIAGFISLISSAAMIYFIAALPFHLPTPRRILIVILLVYFSYIYFLRRNYFKLDAAKINVYLFGQSATLQQLSAEMASSRGFKVRAWEQTPSAQRHYSLRNLDYVVIGSKLFAQQPEAWDIISRDFIAKGAVVDTDFNVYEKILRRSSRESIEDNEWLLRGIGSRQENTIYPLLKRAADVVLALLMLPFLLPLAVLIWVLIRVIDGYAPLFIQKRVGQLEKPIYIYKFRTIKPGGTEENITRCGKILRRFRLDEIPQLFNVLRGDISFVGPRPIWFNEHEFLQQYVPNHALRTLVKPGITGWAQLNFKAPPTYFNSREHSPENLDPVAFEAAFTRFSYDVWYIKNRSLLLDFEIMIKTGLRMFIKDSKVS